VVLYEVCLHVAPEIGAAYRDWLATHVGEILTLEGFETAEVFEDEPGPDGALRLAVHYRLRDTSALDRYLADHAPRMRAEGVARFGDRFTATRRVLRRVQAFGG